MACRVLTLVNPLTASGAQSADGKSAYVQIYLRGNMGETIANESIAAVRRASLPPVRATSIMPDRIMCIACPIAWLDDAQADATEYTAPRTPNSMEIWLAGALGMMRGTVKGCTRRLSRP